MSIRVKNKVIDNTGYNKVRGKGRSTSKKNSDYKPLIRKIRKEKFDECSIE
jgi:hypothetical protein